MKLRRRDLFTRLLRSRPLMLAALLYLAGCILEYALNAPLAAYVCAIILPVVIAVLLRSRRRIACAVLIMSLLPLGALCFDLNWHLYDPFPEQKEALLSGRICEIPDWRADTQRAICVLEEITIDGESRPGNIRLYLRGDEALLQDVQLGQQVTCTAHIWQGDAAANPGQFDFDRYLRLNALKGYATAEIEEAAFTAPSYQFKDWPERLRMILSDRVEHLFDENTDLAKAFLLGDRSELSQEDRSSYSQSGIAHLLAISGMHVSVLAMCVTHALGRFLGKRTSFFITLVLLILYGMLIGFPASLVRAVMMFAVFQSAPIFGRYSDPPTRLAASMLAYLLLRPIAILDAGFVLSYGASAGIIFLKAPLSRLLHLEGWINLRPRDGIAALFTNRLPRWLAQSLLVTLSAQLTTLPAVVHYFGAQPLWSIFANLLAIPLAMLAYILAIIAAILGVPLLAVVPDFLFGLLTDCAAFFGSLPMASLKIARFPPWLLLICAAACFLASDLSRINEKIRRFLPLTVILAVFVSNLCATLTTLGCSIVYLDAGEADCAVIRTEGSVYLIDTGDSYSPAADYLSAYNYTPDAVFLSHCHTDHSGGLAGILEVCTPGRIYLSANWSHYEIDEAVAAALQTALDRGSEIIYLSAGDTVPLSDKTLLEVLSPPAGISADSANDDSLILRVSHGDCSAVFTGDATVETSMGLIGDADILKIAHHGAQDGTNASLLAEVSPSVSIIPTGYNNYGHPAQQTLKVLDASGCAVYRTDLHGAISCRLKTDGSIAVRTYKSSEEVDGLE